MADKKEVPENEKDIPTGQVGNQESIPTDQVGNQESIPTNQVGNQESNPTGQVGNQESIPTDQVGNQESDPDEGEDDQELNPFELLGIKGSDPAEWFNNADDIDEILRKAAGNAESQPSESSGGGIGDINSLKQEIEASKDRYLRLMAEFDNYKRRSAKEYERLVESANEKLILEIVEVRENFERALKVGEQGGETGPFFEGMKMIFANFEKVLNGNGLTAFAEVGEEFDPIIHDAMMSAKHDSIPPDHITEVFKRGYRLKERVIQHAQVIVSQQG